MKPRSRIRRRLLPVKDRADTVAVLPMGSWSSVETNWFAPFPFVLSQPMRPDELTFQQKRTAPTCGAAEGTETVSFAYGRRSGVSNERETPLPAQIGQYSGSDALGQRRLVVRLKQQLQLLRGAHIPTFH